MRRTRRSVAVVGTAVAALTVGVVPALATSSPKPAPALRAAGAAVTRVSTLSAPKSWTGQLARSDKSLLHRTDATPVNVMVKYDVDAPASYRGGGAAGLPATSPAVTHRPLARNADAVSTYQRYLDEAIARTSHAALASVPQMTIRSTYAGAFGGVEARIPANRVEDVLKVPGVVAVMKDNIEHPLDDATSYIGAQTVWPTQGGQANAGSNTVVGVIDTGVWPESPFFVANPSEPAPPHPLSFYGCQFGDGSDTAHFGPTFSCNNKLIGAYGFTQTSMSLMHSTGQEFCNDTTGVCTARDAVGHGTHAASVAVGDVVDHPVMYGVDRGSTSGVAPGAHLIAFRVCVNNSCASSDAIHAVQQAIHDGVNVLNVSISGGTNPYSDPLEISFLDAENAGISVAAAAGNNGPGAGTVEHAAPWVTTVGAVTSDRQFGSTLHLTGDGGATLDVPGATVTNGVSSPTPVVLAATLPKAGGGNEDALCQSDLAPGAATGKVVVCNRGTNSVLDKGRRVLAGGAAGMILTNNAAAITDLGADNHYLPTIHVQFNGNAVANFVSSHTNVMATWATGSASASAGDVMASFSSRGPEGDWLKPDLVAPGVQVFGGTTPQPDQTTADNGPPGNLYQVMSGTSAATPQVAGAMALLHTANPTWTPPEVKSALMTSTVQGVLKEDGTTPASVFDSGAGSLRVSRAINPSLVLNETYANFVNAGSDTLHRVDLNLPSIDAPTMTGTLTTHRTFLNVSGQELQFVPTIVAPTGATITIDNLYEGTVVVAKDASVTVPITISAPSLPNGQYTGRITLTPVQGGSNAVTIPVAFVRTQGVVKLTQSCSPTTFDVSTEVAHCTATVSNTASSTANANLSIGGDSLSYHNITDPGVATPSGVGWAGSLTPAAAPSVTAINNITGQGPNGGYLPLSAFGSSTSVPSGDDTINNFNVPTFYYGGEPYSQVGVVSNGYIVIGGGDTSDLVFAPQQFPNAARPNNVLAPLWTDLNPSANSIKINVLTDGSTDWIIVDWEGVKNFGDATTHTFEVWIRAAGGPAGTGPGSEEITYDYGGGTTPANAATGDPDSGVNWGAENRDGTSGRNLTVAPANGSEYRPVTSPPVAGGSKAISYDISAAGAGSYASNAELTTNLTPGTTQVVQALTATGKFAATLSFAQGTLAQTYDGSPKPVSVTSAPAGLDGVTVTYDGSPTPPTEPGSYAVVASLDNPGYIAPDLTGTLVIGKIPATLSITTSTLTQEYDGTARSVAVTTSPPGLTGVSVSYDGSSTPPSAVGAYSVVASLTNPHYAAPDATGTLTVGKAPAALNLDHASLSQVYDGQQKPVTVTTTPGSLTGVSVTYDGSSTPPTDAGSYDVHVSLSNPSYAATDVSAVLVISKAPAALHLSTSSLTQTYDGTAKPVTVTTSPAVLSGVSVTYDGSATAPSAIGSYPVVVSLSNPNYSALDVTGTLTIGKAAATLLVDHSSLHAVYDGSTKPVTVTTAPADLDGVTVTYDGSTTPPSDAGVYDVEVSLANSTYTAAPVSAVLVIDKAPAALHLSTSSLTHAYDGSPKPVTVTTSPSVLSGVSVTYDGSTTPPTSIGSYPVVVSLSNPNYTASDVSGTLVIGQAAATLTLDHSSLHAVYDGSAKPVTVTTAPADLDGVIVTYDGSSTAPTDAGVYDVEVSLANSTYAAAPVSAVLVIDKAPASLHVDSASLAQTYDGTPRAVSVTTTPPGLDGVTVTYDGSSTSPSAPGVYAVAATLDNANYAALEADATLVVSKAKSAIVFGAMPPLRFGRTATLHATMTTLGAPAVGQTLRLMARPAGTKTWTQVGSAVTTVAGVASVPVHPRVNTAYQWVFTTTATTLASNSPARTLVVQPVVTLALTKTTVRHGLPVTFWGTVTPGAAKQSVTLQRLSGTRWVSWATAKLVKQRMPDGHRRLGYLFTETRATKGTIKVRVVRPATSSLGKGISPAKTLKVT